MTDVDFPGFQFNFTIDNNDLKLDPDADLILVDEDGRTVMRLDAQDGVISVTAPVGSGHRMLLRARDGDLRLGGNGRDGDLILYPRGADPAEGADRATIHLDARQARGNFGLPSEPGSLQVIGAGGNGVRLEGTGEVRASRAVALGADGEPVTAQIGPGGQIVAGGDGEAGQLDLRSASGDTTILLNGASANARLGGSGQNGQIELLNADGAQTFLANGATGNLAVGGPDEAGIVFVKAGTGSDNGNGAVLNGERSDLLLGGAGSPGTVSLRTAENTETVAIRAEIGAVIAGGDGVAGDVIVRNANGANTLHLQGDTGTLDVEGDIRFVNAGDLAESFAQAEEQAIAPGTVLVIGPDGRMAPCADAYDSRVAGVVSGALGIKPGMILNAEGRLDDGPGAHLALAGRVAVLVDASYGAIVPGDLITTSPNAGHGMKAHDKSRTTGAILGKALGRLDEGKGLVPCLVALS